MLMIATRLRMVGVALCSLGLAACSEESVRTYTVPKGSETIVSMSAASAPAAPAIAPLVEFAPVWTVPEGWREADENPPMRLTTFFFDGPHDEVEVAISRFPGDVGGLLANVNRWRGQIGLEPVSAGDLDELTESFETPRFRGHLLHLQGPQVHMLAASIFEPAEDRTWYVRVLADAETAEAVKPAVFAFARSFGTGDEE